MESAVARHDDGCPLFLNFFIVNFAVRVSLKCESRY
jgi:hypothetical protein